MSNIPGAWLRVINAATQLTGTEQRLLVEMAGLDNDDRRCWANAAYLAWRLGQSTEGVENARRELKQLEIVSTSGRRCWWVDLPAGCRPSSERPSDAEVDRLARQLDEHITHRREPRALASAAATLPSTGPTKGGSQSALSARRRTRNAIRLTKRGKRRTTVRLTARRHCRIT